jgi:hypothetical protein
MVEIDRTLHHEVNQVQRMIVQLDQSLTVVGNQVSAVGQEQRETRNDLTALRDEFLAFVQRAEFTANRQQAETRIGVLEGRLDSEFGHHKVVRRTAVGMLQGFDVGLVSEETVRNVGEQLMMQTPRYWLAPVLVALAAWAGDNEDLCRRGVEEAFRRSPDRTSLFMALVLRRQGRPAGAVRWLRHYLNAQDPAKLGREFAVILESVSQGAFGPAGVELMHERLDGWREQLLTDESIQAAQVRQWRAEIDNHVTGTHGHRYPALMGASPQWPLLDRALCCAEVHQALVEKYTAMFAEELPVSDRLEDAIDDILDRLVGEYDPEELPLRRELAYNETVVEHEGDVAQARQMVHARIAALESTRDYLSIQTQSALTPEDIGVSRQTQRVAVAACAGWFGEAHAGFTMNYRRALPSSVEATLGTGHNAGSQAFQMPPWTGSFTLPAEQLERSLAGHWDQFAQPYLDSFTAGWKTRVIVASVVGGLGFLLLTLCLGVVGFGLGLLGCTIAAAVLYYRWQDALKRQNDARAFIARAKEDSIRQLRAAGSELTDWSTRFQQADAGEQRVGALVADLARAGQAAAPYERRSVESVSGRGTA